jgi:hypothetical protein
MGLVGVGEAIQVAGGRVNRALTNSNLMNLLCRASWSSLILAKLMTSLSVYGLNFRISSIILAFKLTINIPTNAFYTHLLTLLSSFSNSRW